ncbi:Aspartate--tRNA ligase [Frankliniella fusca]|uniref:Aspartate--tRNA ligase n=1 Tax=Frankliniella fusca TaxID=407009 RepID=A0AAE1HG48_9NEOP|nr:Aspartate--tRNA ligase [Frankliniella fusca]
MDRPNLDKGGSSSRTAFRTVNAVAAASKLPVKNLKCSHVTLWRKRVQDRVKRARAIREAFKLKQGKNLTVHWDGIKVDPLVGSTRRKAVERLPVVVTGQDIDQLLGAHVIRSSSGDHSAAEVVSCLHKWECADDVVALCSDTPTGNTGYKMGTATRIEKALGKPLLYLACRHHMLELIPKGLFDKLFEKSSSPDIGVLCKALQGKWDTMDHTAFTPGVQDPACRVFLLERRDSILSFAEQNLEKPHTRADYRQLLELVVIFMGENPFQPKPVRFSPPIAVSSARFMARIIYCLLIHMFALTGEFKMDQKVLENVRELNVFFVTTYLEPWYTATNVASAPLTDLKLLKTIVRYDRNPQVSKIASDVFHNHLWYLHHITVGLAFFDDKITVEEKRKMVEKLDFPPPKSVSQWKRFVLPPRKELGTLKDSAISDFINSDTREDPVTWPENNSYRDGLSKVQALQVVNDVAERGVALVKRFSKNPLTRREDIFQDILLTTSCICLRAPASLLEGPRPPLSQAKMVLYYIPHLRM